MWVGFGCGRVGNDGGAVAGRKFRYFYNHLTPLIVDLFMRWLLLRFVLPLLIALPIGYSLLYPEVLRCEWVSHSDDFVAVPTPGGAVYLNRVTLREQGQTFLANLRQARLRIHRFWGKPQGGAVLIYCPLQEQYENYCAGGEGAGCSLGTPWGQSFLIIGPDGNSADVIAHELCHDELYARLGWLRVKRDIPQWFNEGLAMMLDYRFSVPVADATVAGVTVAGDSGETAAMRYQNYRDEWLYRSAPARGGKRHPTLSLANLETTRDFFGGDYAHVMLAYTTAGLEVSRWLARAGQPAVPKLATELADGADFRTAYQRLERDTTRPAVRKPIDPVQQLRPPRSTSAGKR